MKSLSQLSYEFNKSVSSSIVIPTFCDDNREKLTLKTSLSHILKLEKLIKRKQTVLNMNKTKALMSFAQGIVKLFGKHLPWTHFSSRRLEVRLAKQHTPQFLIKMYKVEVNHRFEFSLTNFFKIYSG